jgi:hypothetical protein
MLRIEELRWSSRTDVCDQLLRYLQSTSPAPLCDADNRPNEPALLRRRAALLLVVLVDRTAHRAVLRQLLLNPAEDPDVRRAALRKLSLWVRQGLQRASGNPEPVLSVDQTAQLLTDPATAGAPPDRFSVLSILALCPVNEALRVAVAFLEQLSPAERARLLQGRTDPSLCREDCHLKSHPAVDAVFDWLYDRWLMSDRWLLEGPEGLWGAENIDVVLWTQERPESRAVLTHYWRRLDDEARSTEGPQSAVERLLQELASRNRPRGKPPLVQGWRERLLSNLRLWPQFRALCVADFPAARARLAEALALPLPQLLDHLGPDRFLQLLEQKIRRAGRGPLPAAMGDPRPPIWLLSELPEADLEDWSCSLLACSEVEAGAKLSLFYYLFERHRNRAVSLALQAARASGETCYADWTVTRIARSPEATDRELLLWGSWRSGQPRVIHAAIQGLEALGEDSDWWRRWLELLTQHQHPLVRLQALAALVRRGDRNRLTEIASAAITAPEVAARGNALWHLVELDPHGHLPLFRRVLFEDRGNCSDGAPPYQVAAFALARIGTPEALTALVRRYLQPNFGMSMDLDDYLETIAAAADDQKKPDIQPHNLQCRSCFSQYCQPQRG